MKTTPHDVTERDIQIIKDTLMEQMQLVLKRGNKMLWCLEWGAGGSTVYFPKFLAETQVPFHWHSLEHNAEWYENVTRELGPNLAV